MKHVFFDKSDLAYLGLGAIVGYTVRIRKPEQASIGEYCIIDDFTYISGSLTIGKYSHIGPNCNLVGSSGKIEIGRLVGISAGCSIFAASSDYLSASMDLPSAPEHLKFGGIVMDVTIDDYCLIGCGTIILPGVILPQGVATGAGTILRKRTYKPWTLYEGADGREVAKRDHTELFKRLKLNGD